MHPNASPNSTPVAHPRPSTMALVHAPFLSATVGQHHDPNLTHRRSMEDETAIEIFHDFPGLFVAVYDGHGGVLAATLLRQLLHRYFLDHLLEEPQPPSTTHLHHPPSPQSDPSDSDCSTPPYADEHHNHSHQPPSPTVPISHPLNTLHLDVTSALQNAYASMDAALRVRRCLRVGSTAITCFLRTVPGVGRVLTTANCGDARAVLSRAGRPIRLSQDHRPQQDFERARIEKAGGFVTAGRVNGILNVSRAFGDHSMKSVVVSTPYVHELVLESMDDFLVLACDGLWDFVDEKCVISLAQHAFDRGLSADAVAAVLVKEAIDRKGTDNVSVMVVQLDMLDCCT